MREIVRSFTAHPVLSLGSVVLWGLIEFVALRRSQAIVRAEAQG